MGRNVTETEKPRVQSVARVFELLEIVADNGGEMQISEIAAHTGLPLPTIHRLVRTMVDRGYMRQMPNRRYALGPRLIRLGEVAGGMLASWARPLLTDLVDQLDESANLAVLDGDMVTYVAQVPSRHAMRLFTEVGRRVRPHCTGVGKALLSQLPDEAVRALLARTGTPALTPRTITDPDELMVEIVRIRSLGYAMDEGEQEIGVRCIAAPVPNPSLRMAVSVSGPAARMTDELIARARPLLAHVTRLIAAEAAQQNTA
jgi:IclR family acetate operon transcriptional repressor